MKAMEFEVQFAVGLHARPAAKLAKLAKGFESTIRIRNMTRNGEEVDAKSLVKLIKIAAVQHHIVHISVEGRDEEAAFAAVRRYMTEVPEEDR